MKKKTIPQNEKQQKKLYFSWVKSSKSENPFLMMLSMMREYGIFIIALAFCYMLFYYVLFEADGDDLRGMYAVIASSVLVVSVAAYILRHILRTHRFEKYSSERVPLFKNNVWRCPSCGKENRLLSPCDRCGVFPVLYKIDKKFDDDMKKVKSKKLQKQYDEYKPVFSDINDTEE